MVEDLDFWIELLNTIFLTCFVLSRVPQIYRLYKLKSSIDISLTQYWALSICSNVTIVYGFYKDSPSMVIANFINCIIATIILFQCYYYRMKK